MDYITSWQHQVEEALQTEKPVTGNGGRDDAPGKGVVSWEMDEPGPVTCGYDYTAGTQVDASEKGDRAPVEDLIKDIDFASQAGQINETENSKRRPNEDEARKKERNQTNADQKAKELEGIQKYIAQQKEAARKKAAAQAKEALKKANFARSSASGSVENLPNDQAKQHGSQQTGRADGDLIRRCLRSAIPSIAATTGTDILELISLDILNKHLGLNIDISDAWERVLGPQTAYGNVEAFLGECAPDPYAWSILKREGPFTLNLGMVILAFERDENRRSRNHEYLIGILETLREILEDGVQWEIVPDTVPRTVMRMAITVAKEGPDPPGFDGEDEDFRIDPFLALLAGKSESSLFGTPDSDNPRYWNFWSRRDGFNSRSS
jgi:hypothetical protein